jgi:hypothetical protein
MYQANTTASLRPSVRLARLSGHGVSRGILYCLQLGDHSTNSHCPVFPYIQAAGGDNKVATAQYPFWVSSSLCVLSAGLTLFCLPHIGQDTIQLEDERFRAHLEANGYDTRQLGMKKGELFESTDVDIPANGVVESAKGEKTAA